jgi:hypothetical protein
MTDRHALFSLLIAAALPLQASASTCVFVAQTPDGKGETTCKYLETAALCEAEAARNGTQEWLKAHPPTFVSGKNCNAAVKALQPQKGASGKDQKQDKAAVPPQTAPAK